MLVYTAECNQTGRTLQPAQNLRTSLSFVRMISSAKIINFAGILTSKIKKIS
jgi:hypothetical protein